MPQKNKKSNYLILLDKIIGLRAWGLILYGVLPANLSLLGTLKVKVEVEVENINELWIFASSVLPLFLIFILIRSKHRDWYITSDILNIRSIINTVLILTISTIICCLSQFIRENEFSIFDSFLLALVSLVASSALFMTVMTKNDQLPGLPSIDFINIMKAIRNKMRNLQKDAIWSKYTILENAKLIECSNDIIRDINQADFCTGNYIAKKSLKLIKKDILELIEILEEIGNATKETKMTRWKIYFANCKELSVQEKSYRSERIERFSALERLCRLRLGD